MRIAPQFGSDTGMWLVDVFLETEEEQSLDDDALWRGVAVLLDAQRIDARNVVDTFTHVKNGQGEWGSATRNAEGKLVPVSW